MNSTPLSALLAALLLTPLPLSKLYAADPAPPAARAEARGDAAWLAQRGTLLFHDAFDRDENGNGLKAIGNGWESATADRVPHIRQADLDEGILKISSASKEAGHAVHIHHDAGFADGGVVLRFRFPGLHKDENLTAGFVDRELKGVHAGHLCYAKFSQNSLTLIDQRSGISEESIRSRRAEFLARKEPLPADLQTLLAGKEKTVPFKADLEWHELTLVTEGDEMRVSLDGDLLCAHRSEGFAHPAKRWFSLSANNTVWIDEVRIWKVK